MTNMTNINNDNKPDYILKALDKTTGETHRVGAAWLSDKGNLSIAIDRFVVLAGRDASMQLTLFPNDNKFKK